MSDIYRRLADEIAEVLGEALRLLGLAKRSS